MMKLIRYEYPQAPNANDLNQLFGELWNGFSRWPFEQEQSAFQPAADLYEDEHNIYARFELPGFKKSQLTVQLENSVLTVNAERKGDESNGRSEQRISRSVSVPDDIQADAVSAQFEDGVLTVTLPKSEASKPRQIEVQ